MKPIITHNYDNYYGLLEKIDNMPHFLSTLLPFVPGLAEANQKNAFGTTGTLWSGTPISDMIVGKAHAEGPTPSTNVQDTSTYRDSGNPLGAIVNQGGGQLPATGGNNPANYVNQGGDSRLQALAKADRNPVQESEYQRLLAELNGGQNQTNALIDEAYGQSASYLNQAEDALRNDYPTILQEIEAQKAGALRTAQTGFDSSMGTVKTNEESAQLRNQNVMADARRMYDELRRGYGQRFGGASSAGQAATELGNLEQQRQAGRQQQDFQQTMKQIESKRIEINQKFEDQKFQLEQITNQAKNEANRDFQNKLLQIAQSRAENEQAKAQARLSALQDLRNKVYQIQLQNLQFQQTLQAQKQQAEIGLNDYASSLSGLSNDTAGIASSFNPTVSSNLQVGGTNAPTAMNPYVGSIGSGRNPDELFGSITPRRPQDFLA